MEREPLQVVRLRAHAKVNLTLDVLQKRPDGYHEIETVFQAISLGDRLTFRRVEAAGQMEVSLEEGEIEMPLDESNLISKAAKAFFERYEGKPFGAAVQVLKRIPMQAGLGGGSSDAAATLRALNALADRPLSEQVLSEIAASLGADAAFFLRGGTAFASGKGERLEWLPELPPLPLVIVKPEAGVSTAWAYELLDAQGERESGRRSRTLREAILGSRVSSPSLIAPFLFNDFHAPILKAAPEVAEAERMLQSLDAMKTLLCGSGSALFGVFETAHQARAAALGLQKQGLWAVFAHTAPAAYTQTV